MVAGEAGGIPMQMPAGAGGFLVSSIEECAEKLLYLLRNPEAGAELARSGKEAVRGRFLLPRLISDELELYADLLGARPAPGLHEGIR
jgi:trehalose synthase